MAELPESWNRRRPRCRLRDHGRVEAVHLRGGCWRAGDTEQVHESTRTREREEVRVVPVVAVCCGSVHGGNLVATAELGNHQLVYSYSYLWCMVAMRGGSSSAGISLGAGHDRDAPCLSPPRT